MCMFVSIYLITDNLIQANSAFKGHLYITIISRKHVIKREWLFWLLMNEYWKNETDILFTWIGW